MTSRAPVLLLDSASLYFRAFFGVPDRRENPDDPPNNAVRGFLDMIATLVTAHRPSGLVACWDDDWRPAFRVEAIPSYKTHRLAENSPVSEESPEELTPQVPVIVAALAALGIPRVGAAGYEADDVIGTLTTRFAGEGRSVDVVTGDRDLFQLVDDAADVRVLYTARGGVRDPDLVDQAFLRSTYDVASGDAYADFAVLRGDPSDGLPGVRGVGPKSAAALLHAHGDLAGIRAALAAGDPSIKGAQRTRLLEGSDYLDAAPRVVRVVRDIDLGPVEPGLPTQVADPALMSRLAVDYRLTGAFTRVVTALGIA
ncbi:5'-3' exonuclease [Kineosphaera limosa]|uniref:5'-3' exonuclease n=1 Tax=Kineosphaera limosa NBRC 100340 TaxID=1184609 RepID=K6WQY7_9MICO|nr:5'-3' exonuclease [Kineosphaera limosa]NYE03230.1 5'-3' exonuclease [Kineosphaera limosa]GAB96246.1 putative 5'-3' exonuclease [Kineosphaera limosa NBRC 100340]